MTISNRLQSQIKIALADRNTGQEIIKLLNGVDDGLPVSGGWLPGSVDSAFFVATRAYTVVAARARVDVAGTDAGAVTAVIKKAPSGTALASGTALHTGTINLKGTAATNQALTLEAAANLEIAAGDCIGFDFTGTLTAAVGMATVYLKPKE